MKNALNFSYPLDYSYYIENDCLSSIKAKAKKVVGVLEANGFEEIKLPFIVSPYLIEPYTTEYKKENLLKIFPGSSKSKYSYLSPYMLFLQAVPLLRSNELSYKSFPIKWYDSSSSYKRIIKSVNDPYLQLEEFISFQGGIFSLSDKNNGTFIDFLSEMYKNIFTILKIDYTITEEKLFYKTSSNIFRDKNGVFLGGFHQLSAPLNKVGTLIKNKDNKIENLHLTSIAISQNILL